MVIKIILKILFILSFVVHASGLYAAGRKIAVYPVHSGNAMTDASADAAAARIRSICFDLSRFSVLPESALSQNAVQSYISGGIFDKEKFMKEKGVSLFLSLSVRQNGASYTGRIEKTYSDGRVESSEIESTVLTVIALNIEKEILKLHEAVPLECRVIKRIQNVGCIIDRGDSAGLTPGAEYKIKEIGTVRIVQTSRATSLVTGYQEIPETFSLEVYENISSMIGAVDTRIEKEIFRKYGTDSAAQYAGQKPETRFIQSVLIINPLSNILLPGFGAYLSTAYIGFQNPRPSYAGIAAAIMFETYQLAYIPAATGWRGNFFPWVHDSNKSSAQMRYHRFLWATIPLTWTVAYTDQLSAQYEQFNVLPFLFENRNAAALCVAAVIPGGGLFYKGYRFAGWSFYAAEFALAGYYYKNKNENSGRRALYGAIGMKGAEMILSFFIQPSYKAYIDGIGKNHVELAISAEDDQDFGDTRYFLGMTMKW